jgi:hypothetical protein
MVQAEHHPLLRTGGADATPDQPATGRSTRPVSSFSEDATVDAAAAGGPAGDGAFAGATAAATPSRPVCRNKKVMAKQALSRMREIMDKLKLTVNEEKTRICRVPEGEFDFLGYTFGRLY